MSPRPRTLIVAAVLIALSGAASRTASAGEPAIEAAAAAITAESLLATVGELADPAREGRLPGTSGYDGAAALMAERFAALGLQPAGDDGWFQRFAIECNEIDACALAVRDDGDSWAELTPGSDFVCRGFTGSGEAESDVVFVGYGLSLPERGYDDYAGVDVDGRIVLAFKQAPGWKIDEEGWDRADNPRPKALAARAHGARALLLMNTTDAWGGDHAIGSVLHGPGEHPVDMPQLHLSRAWAAVLAGEDLLLTKLRARIDSTRTPASRPLPGRARLAVTARHRPEADTMNVVGRLPGAEPADRDSVLIIGAHLDHVGRQGAVVFPGANDNASGSAAVLAIAEAFVRSGLQPRHAVVFVLFSGEEQGLCGARRHAEFPTAPLDRTVAMMNLDCVAHGDSIRLGNGESAPRLWNLARGIDAAGAALSVAGTWKGGGADATPFHEAGVPTLYFATTNSYTHLHLPSDKPGTLNGELFAELTRLAFRTAAAVAGGEYSREDLSP